MLNMTKHQGNANQNHTKSPQAHCMTTNKNYKGEIFLVAQQLRLCTPNAGGPRFNPWFGN